MASPLSATHPRPPDQPPVRSCRRSRLRSGCPGQRCANWPPSTRNSPATGSAGPAGARAARAHPPRRAAEPATRPPPPGTAAAEAAATPHRPRRPRPSAAASRPRTPTWSLPDSRGSRPAGPVACAGHQQRHLARRLHGYTLVTTGPAVHDDAGCRTVDGRDAGEDDRAGVGPRGRSASASAAASRLACRDRTGPCIPSSGSPAPSAPRRRPGRRRSGGRPVRFG